MTFLESLYYRPHKECRPMPEGQEPNKRMLFTDFDASEKGRPVAASVSPLPADNTRFLPTLADIASTLELDFEEDAEEAAAEFSPGDEDGEDGDDQPRDPRPRIPQRADDSELSLDESAPNAAEKRKSATRHIPAPTWEEFTRTFHERSEPARPQATAPGPFLSTPSHTDPDVISEMEPAGASGDDMDVLSMLATMAEDAFTAPAFQPFRTAPGGGPGRVDDWYEPPEREARSKAAGENWYEPPSLWTDGENGGTAGLPAGRPENGSRQPPTEETSRSGDPGGDTTVVLFSDLDLDRLWQEKLDRIQAKERGETRNLDLFDGVDLEQLWSDKTAQPVEEQPSPPPDAEPEVEAPWDAQFPDEAEAPLPLPDTAMHPDPQPARGEAGEDTVIVAPDVLNAADTAVLPENFHHGKDTPAMDITDEPPEIPAIGSFARSEVNAEADRLFNSTAPEETGRPLSATTPEENAHPDSLSFSGVAEDPLAFLDDLDAGWDDFIAGADVAVPQIGDDDLQDLRETKKKKRAAAPPREQAAEAAAPVDETIPPDEPETEWNEAGFTSDMPDAGAVFGAEEHDYIPDVAGEEEEGGRVRHGLTTDDLLDEIDFDQYGVNNEVSAPVIDDSAIDTVTRRRRKDTAGPKTTLESDEIEEPESVQAGTEGESGTADPADIFAHLEEMDFSDDLEDELRDLVDDEETPSDEESRHKEDGTGPDEESSSLRARGRKYWRGVREYADAAMRKVLPARLLTRLQQLVAWRENWWFYCDLAAAIIASASLAVIISHWFWYR